MSLANTEIIHKVRRVCARVIAVPISLYRACLGRVVFIGITGSCGKTTTKELVAAVLASRYRGVHSRGTRNVLGEVMLVILRARPWHRFCVQELTVGWIGEALPLERRVQLLRPQIGVITNIGTDHISALGSVEAIAAEKKQVDCGVAKKWHSDPQCR